MFWNKPGPKIQSVGTKRSENLKIKASVTKQIRAISEVEVEIFLFKSKFLGFVEAPVGLFICFFQEKESVPLFPRSLHQTSVSI